MKKKATMQQVADRAGVSKSAVSMILNSAHGSFSNETILRVKKAAAELNYIKPGVESQPPMLIKDSILIVNPNTTNLYFPHLIQSIESTAREKGFETVIYNTYRDPARETAVLLAAMSAGLQGVIYTYFPSNAADIEQLNQLVPTVTIGEFNTPLNVNTIGVDYYRAGRMIAEHLISLGHRRVAFVSTPIGPYNYFRARRWKGVLDVFEGKGDGYVMHSKIIRPVESMELRVRQIEHEIGFNMARSALMDDPEITAFIGVNDQVAYGIIDYLRAGGCRIPEDYSVCGFDNTISTPYMDIQLTTVEPATQERGQSAVEVLIQEIARRDVGREKQEIFFTKIEHQNRLIVGNSTGAPRKNE